MTQATSGLEIHNSQNFAQQQLQVGSLKDINASGGVQSTNKLHGQDPTDVSKLAGIMDSRSKPKSMSR